MKQAPTYSAKTVLAVAVAALLPLSASAAADTAALKQQLKELQHQLQAIQKKIDAQQQETAAMKEKVKKAVAAGSEWKNANSVVHLAGYGSVGYTDNQKANGQFSQVQFSPIFHYQYKDLLMLESELEITNTPDAGTAFGMEYLTLDLFLNDNATLVAGKFLSPIGQFRQNFHPSWINKMPTMPVGFGEEGGAAPVSDTGVELRGGFPVSGMHANYAIYVANGPELVAVDSTGNGKADGLDSIAAEGSTADVDGSKVWGGRIGLLPIHGLEVGLSFATGKAAVTTLLDDTTGTSSSVSNAAKRNYDVFDGDLTWHYGNLDVRGEYVQTKIGSDSSNGATATSGATWRAWYTQAAYQFRPTKFEGVVRYTDFNSPNDSEDQTQWAVGLNYLFASNVIAKVAYEFNDGQSGAATNDDSFLVQLAYGF